MRRDWWFLTIIAGGFIMIGFGLWSGPTQAVVPDPRKPRWEQVPADGMWVAPDTTGPFHRLPQGSVIQIPHWTAPPSVGHRAEGDA